MQSKTKSVTEGLSVLLADTFALALKTQNYHWNVVGSAFYSLHKLFEGQYEALYQAADDIAERIRALGIYAPGGLSDFLKLTTLAEAKKNIQADMMLKDLAQSHTKVIASIKALIQVAQESQDEATFDLSVKRLDFHEKTLWMLKSSL